MRNGQGNRWRAAALLSLALASTTWAGDTVTRFELQRDGMTLRITAPRDDILHVRAARGALGEDTSWAVADAVRLQSIPLRKTQNGKEFTLRTAALVARIDTDTWRLTIEDAAGHEVLTDAPGGALAFEAGADGAPASLRMRKHMPEDAHYFGLGDKTGPLDRRDQAFVLWNTDAGDFTQSTDPLYKSIPFVLGVRENGRSMGLFLDNHWRSSFDFGKTERGTLRIGAEGGEADYYVFAADDPKTVVRTYAYLTGTAPLAPLWALGYQQSRYSYETEAEARAIVNRLRADRIPTDALYLDIDYQDRYRPFTVSKQAFPDLPRFVKDLKSVDMRLVLITDLHIAHAPGQGYAPFDSGAAADAFVKRADGSVYVADVWPGASVFPDFSREPVRRWWGGLYGDFVQAGVAGFWNDMNEPAVFNVRSKTMPLDNVHRIENAGFAPRVASHAEMHNLYGMLNSRATYEGLRELTPTLRPFVLTRASYAGGQKYAATWTGDNSSSWNHLRMSVPMLVNLGLSGFSMSGADVGGFAGAGPSADLLTRWIEVGAFTPLFRDHAAKGKPPQEPWMGGKDHEAIRRRYIEERYRLMPYLYALSEAASRDGVPMMRPVFLEFPGVLSQGELFWRSQDQFMLGPDLLIAPAPDGESPAAYKVMLPGEGWYDYWSGLTVSAAAFSETPRLDRLPVFVRPGAILPRQPLVQSTLQKPAGPLEIAVYPGARCEGQLYQDDGVSFAYARDGFLRQSLRCEVQPQELRIEFGARQGRYVPWWSGIELTVHGVNAAPRRVLLGKRRVPADYDADAHALHVRLPDIAVAARVVVEMPATVH